MRVYLETDTYEVSETDGRVEVCVIREGDVSESLTILVSTGDFVPLQAEGIDFHLNYHGLFLNVVLLCAAGSDYVAVRQSVTFAPNRDRVCFNVTILNDQLSEGVENFVARITSVPSGVDIGTPDTAVISIMDDESKNCISVM